jgi:predicted dehydrogenase
MTTTIGVLGAAGIAPAAILRPVLRQGGDVRVAAVASRRNAREYADEHGIERAYDSYQALLDDPLIDLVYNALPPAFHAVWTVAALEAGKHVLCEKPFTMNAAEAEEVVAAAARTGRRAIEAFHDHYHPLSAEVRSFLAGGGVGTVRAVRAVFEASIPFDPSSIRHVPEVGGGALMDLGCYPVHWVRSLFGEPEVIQASAQQGPLGADVAIAAELALPGGIGATVSAGMVEGTPLRSDLEVLGDQGVLLVQNIVFPSRGHSITVERDGLPYASTVAGRETYDHQLEAVLAALASGTPLPTEGADSVANMRTIDAIYAAAGLRG